jgi:protein SCO1/2
MSRSRVTLMLIVVGVIAGVLFWQFRPVDNAPPAPGMPPGGDFTVQSADGPVSLHDLRGNVAMIYFGYAGCPDVCPTALTRLSQGLKLLTPAEMAHVRALFISVDPERDTPAKLKGYAAFFHPAIVGTTAAPAVIDDIVARYGAAYRKQPVKSAVGYVIDHTSFISVVDPDGKLVARVPDGNAPEDVAATIRRWLPR